jgi:hypothetical protein
MDAILLLIALNFLSVPFLQEAEAQALRLQRFPDPLRILRLAHVRKTGWFRPFCALTAFLFILVAARGKSDGVDGQLLALHTAIIQAVLWSVVYLNARRRVASNPSTQASTRDRHERTTVMALLPHQP